jgi:hypothetical protein
VRAQAGTSPAPSGRDPSTGEEIVVELFVGVPGASVVRPKDKPKAEVSVQIAQRWVLAVLRHHSFFALADLNAAISERIDAINDRPMKVAGVSRRTLFAQIDQPALRPLPTMRYAFAAWKRGRVNIDYHVEVDHNSYSVPYQLVHEPVEVACHGRHRRGLLQGAARGVAPAPDRPRPVCHTFRAQAARASRPRGMDPLTPDRVGGTERAGHRSVRGRPPRTPAASRAGLPRLPGPHAAGQGP